MDIPRNILFQDRPKKKRKIRTDQLLVMKLIIKKLPTKVHVQMASQENYAKHLMKN